MARQGEADLSSNHKRGTTPAIFDACVVDSYDQQIDRWTDQYFKRTKKIVGQFGDKRVTYAIFMRRPVLFAPRLMLAWLEQVQAERGTQFDLTLLHKEGEQVGAGQPLLYLSGSFQQLADLETLLLQKLGPPCVAAYNAYLMCTDLPKVAFLAMDGRHCAGLEMAEQMAYAASVGSEQAKKQMQAVGFIGNATDATAAYFGRKTGLGTMPHALIGYAGSTLRAAEMYHEAFPDEPMTVLVDYFAQEITDSLAVCRAFPEMVEAGHLALRIDTPGGRYLEGLDSYRSYEVLQAQVPDSVQGYRTEQELNYLVGQGTSAAALHALRNALNEAGFEKAKIVASSGFGPAKCRMMRVAQAPIDVVGSGSYLPTRWTETYATADIIEYDGEERVKVGREFLLRSRGRAD